MRDEDEVYGRDYRGRWGRGWAGTFGLAAFRGT